MCRPLVWQLLDLEMEKGATWWKRVEGWREDDTWMEVVCMADLSSTRGNPDRAMGTQAGGPEAQSSSLSTSLLCTSFLCTMYFLCSQRASVFAQTGPKHNLRFSSDAQSVEQSWMQCREGWLGVPATALCLSHTICTRETSSEADCRLEGLRPPWLSEATGTARGQPHSSVAGDFSSC